MSAIVGTRDLLLQATAERYSRTADGKAILLSGETPVFRVEGNGVATPASIAVTAKPINVQGDIVFTAPAGTALHVVGNVATVNFAEMAGDTALVQARISEFGVDYIASYMISKVYDGVVGTNVAQAYAYKRSDAPPADTPGDVIYTFASAAITTPAGNDLANGWSKNIPAGAAPLYVRVASASSRNDADNIGANEWAGAVQLAADGANGLNVASLRIYQRSASNIAPPLPSAPVVLTFAGGAMSGLNNGWTADIRTAGGAYLFTASATASSTSATDVIAASEWSPATRMAADGAAGQRGTVTVTAPGYATWSDASAVYELGNAGYGAPLNRDVVTLYDASHAVTKFYADGSWRDLGTVLNGGLLVNGTVAAQALAVDRLSAISANLGTVTAGDLYAPTLHGGTGYPTNAYVWPGNGGSGYHLSSAGLLLGNYALGRFVQIEASGNLYAPGLSIVNGAASFSGELVAAKGTFSGRLTSDALITGRGQNADNSAFIDFRAAGNEPFLYAGNGALRINANGSAQFARTVLSEPKVEKMGDFIIAPGRVGMVDGGYVPFTVYIDTGAEFSETWYTADSVTYLANATIAAGTSSYGGCNGYSEATLVVGDGLGNVATLRPKDNRIFIRFTWTPVSGSGFIEPTLIKWKLVKV